MVQNLYEILPAFAAFVYVASGVLLTGSSRPPRAAWWLPALLAAIFFGWSLWTIGQQGVAAVWTEHTRNAWGNQIWFDLLMAIGLAVALLAPRARAAGMRPLPWFVLITLTGCIGLYAMMARCLFLEARATPAPGHS